MFLKTGIIDKPITGFPKYKNKFSFLKINTLAYSFQVNSSTFSGKDFRRT
jgi:hypothetical protein